MLPFLSRESVRSTYLIVPQPRSTMTRNHAPGSLERVTRHQLREEGEVPVASEQRVHAVRDAHGRDASIMDDPAHDMWTVHDSLQYSYEVVSLADHAVRG